MLKFCTRVSGSGWTTVWAKPIGTPVVSRGRSAVSKEGSTKARKLVGVPGEKVRQWLERIIAGWQRFRDGRKVQGGLGQDTVGVLVIVVET
jgi:hypothetical protein